MRYDSVASLVAEQAPDRPVVCLRPAVLEATARRFASLFPGDVLYAVKCNPHADVLRALFCGGIRHFDTASLAEVQLVRELLGCETEAYFNHPVKARSAITEASVRYGVRQFVVDSEDELYKVAATAKGDGIHIAIRLATPPGEAVQHMSSKFGAEPSEAASLLRIAKALGFAVGIAVHVGSQCRDPEDYFRALCLAADVRNSAAVAVDTINVGGGFPAPYPGAATPPLEAYIKRIRDGVHEYGFGESRLQCESGRALAADGCSILAQVHLRKDHTLYINDGIFGNLCEMVYLKLRVPMRAYRGADPVPGPDAEFTLYGPTCDPVDVLPGAWLLPDGIQEGDWIEVGQTGAYSSAIATRFNGFATETFIELDEPPFWMADDRAAEDLRTA